MDGMHDLGGKQGFGPICIEADEPMFHHHWEKRIFALSMAAPFVTESGDDQFRRHIESIPALEYLASSYYELWLRGMLGLLRETELLRDEELTRGAAFDALPQCFSSDNQAQVAGLIEAIELGASQAIPGASGPHRFKPGDRVRTCRDIASAHTRLPQYARGKNGRIIAEHGQFIFADANSIGSGPAAEMQYCVEFSADEIWGEEAVAGDSLCLDLWDSYLEPDP